MGEQFVPPMDQEVDWAKVWEIFQPRIYAYIYRRTSDPLLSEDLAAQTFMKAMEAVQSGKGWTSHFSGWLYRIAHNLIIDAYRARDRHKSVNYEDRVSMVDPKPDPHTVAETVIRDQVLRRAMDRLTDEQATAIALRMDGYSFGEIAQSMNKTEGAVKALQHRGIYSLKVLIGHYDDEDEIETEE